MIDIYQQSWIISTFSIKLDYFDLLIDFKVHIFLSFYWHFGSFNQNLVEFDWKYIDTFLLSDFELDQNQCSNLDGLESESSTIQFGGPNHLSLPWNETISYDWLNMTDFALKYDQLKITDQSLRMTE